MVVNSIAAPPDPKRDAKAAALTDSVHMWPLFVLRQPYGAFPAGTIFRRAPSSRGDGSTYKVNNLVCECDDYQRGGYVCKHVRAILLYEARLAAADGWQPIPTTEIVAHDAYRKRLAAEPMQPPRKSDDEYDNVLTSAF